MVGYVNTFSLIEGLQVSIANSQVCVALTVWSLEICIEYKSFPHHKPVMRCCWCLFVSFCLIIFGITYQ